MNIFFFSGIMYSASASATNGNTPENVIGLSLIAFGLIFYNFLRLVALTSGLKYKEYFKNSKIELFKLIGTVCIIFGIYYLTRWYT